MESLYTFIMTSPEIGEVIDQCMAETMIQAWRLWVPSACDWVLKQLPDAGMNAEEVLNEFLSETPMAVPELKNVWMVDVLPEACPDVIQVIIVSA
jgi:hypothetical protein